MALALLSACGAPRVVPTPPPAKPIARPTSVPARAPLGWRDVPITPGNWQWGMEGGQSTARFGNSTSGIILTLQCNRANGSITLSQPGPPPQTTTAPIAVATAPMTITTTSTSRAVAAQPIAGTQPMLGMTLPAGDSLWDAIAFSRGRFAVETPGLPPRYVPSWPEITRVIEDCR